MIEKKIETTEYTWQVILNPNALAGKCLKKWEIIARKLDEIAIRYEPHLALHANAGSTITEHLCQNGKRHFIVLGGDGTLNEVVNGACKSGIDTREVFIVPFPVGTGNDWSRSHHYPSDITALLLSFSNGVFNLHDVGLVKSWQNDEEVDSRYFINIAGFCFDAAVIYQTTKGKPRLFTSIIYIFYLIKVLFTYKSPKVIVSSANFKIDEPIFTIAVGICKYNGNGMMQVPMADPFDGLFDVVIIRKISTWKVVRNVVNLFSGKHVALKEVAVFQTDKLEIKAAPSVLGEVEGEMLTSGNYTISLLPQTVNVLKGKN